MALPSAVGSALSLTLRDLLWLAAYVATGTGAYLDLAHRIDTQAVKIAALVEREAQSLAFLEGRMTEVRTQLQAVESGARMHWSAPGHAVALERTAELQARVGKLETDVRELRGSGRRTAFAVSHVDLPNGRRVHLLRGTEPPEAPAEPPERPGLGDRLTAPALAAWRQVTTPLVAWWRR